MFLTFKIVFGSVFIVCSVMVLYGISVVRPSCLFPKFFLGITSLSAMTIIAFTQILLMIFGSEQQLIVMSDWNLIFFYIFVLANWLDIKCVDFFKKCID